jgi:serine/threonine-protein kinase
VVHRYFHCDPQRLKLLLEDSLPATQQAEVVGHLDSCAACQQALEGLAADRPWWDELRRINGNGRHPGVVALPDTETPDNGRALEALGDGLVLNLLDPPDDPANLGRLGGFAVTSVLGRGGMGVVLQAVDAALNRPVAIKVLAPHFASSGAARKRFAREAQAAAAVVHEHVIAIHHVDSWKGLPYLVMSYVAGRSLQERLNDEGPLEIKEILRIGMQAAAGLAAAHAQGLVHRDVKPANILLENGVERVRLTDFGLARAVDDASLTQSGVIAGTPQYMAPEQAEGQPIDHRADLFSLGSTLYAMCTGRPPFRAESPMAVLRRICDEPAPPVRSVNPDVPGWLASIIDRLHAKGPADRFQSAAEVADLLGRCLAHLQQPDAHQLPLVAAPRARHLRRLERIRPVAAAGLVLALGLGLGLGVSWTPLGRYLFPADITAGPSDPPRGDNRPHAGPNDAALRRALEQVGQETAALEGELRQPAGPGFADPAEGLLRQMRQRLENLEQELKLPAQGQ